MFSAPLPPDDPAHPWRWQLDQFVEEQSTLLAALAHGFYQQWPNKEQYLGLDLQPSPHFIACDRPALETLNRQVNGRIQELVGILAGHDPTSEVAIFVIGPTQFKLLFFQPNPDPAACWHQLGLELAPLTAQLERALQTRLTV